MRFDDKSLIFWLSGVTLFLSLCLNLSCAAPQPPQQANRSPVIRNVAGSTDVMPATEAIYTCNAYDPDGDTLTFTWVADNGIIKGSGNTITWLSPDTKGSYKLIVTVSDGKGGKAWTFQEVKVITNLTGEPTSDPPIELKMSIPSKETVNASKRIRIWKSQQIQCVVEDGDSNSLKYTWTASNGRLQGKGIKEGIASQVDWIAPGVPGDCTVDLIVSDAWGNESRGSVHFKVSCCDN